jgi:uncharacterized protein
MSRAGIMRGNWHWAGLAICAIAGVVLVGRIDLVGRDGQAASAVDDRAAVFEPAERALIAEYHAALRAAHDIDYRVLATAAGADLERAANAYFASAGVGTLSASGRGLLLVIDTSGDRVRLEVSTSLEGVYTDAFVAYVQSRQMAPFFAASRVADGILATTELIVARAQDAQAGQGFAAPMPARSMGGGASSAAPIGTGGVGPNEEPQPNARPAALAGLDPLQVVESYHDRMARRDARTDLPLYSRDTMAMLRGRVVTAAQMDNVERTYRDCTVDSVRIGSDTAVVRYRLAMRQCAPYFLRREDDEWKLDLTAMSTMIRFNHENEWRFRTPIADEYEFAFEDWRVDTDGFPRAP